MSRPEEEANRLSDEEQKRLVTETITLIHDLLQWYTVDELSKETSLHTEMIVVSDIFYHRDVSQPEDRPGGVAQ